MEVNISKNIIYQLQKVGRVSLPEIGSFTLEYISASYGINRSILNPPSYKLSYSDITRDIKGLIQEISDTEKISNDLAKKALFSYTKYLKSTLSSNGSVFIHQLGTLSEENNKLVFKQSDDTSFSKINYSLPQISLTPIAIDENEKKTVLEKLQEETKIAKPAAETIKTPLAKKNGFFTWDRIRDWLIAALLASILIFVFKTCNKNTPTTKPTTTVSTNNDSINNSGTKTSSNISSTSISSTDTSDTIEEAISHLTNSNQKCIIITGSFKRSRNAVKMQTKVSKLGYESYTERYGSFNRVGIKFDCAGKDLPAYIKKIRSQFDIYAWYLEPELAVER